MTWGCSDQSDINHIPCFLAIPAEPAQISLKDEDPTMLVLTILEPTDTGHMPIIGYRVEYDGDMRDFELSKSQ